MTTYAYHVWHCQRSNVKPLHYVEWLTIVNSL